MKKSEKLLDAIGQIDDRLVEEAANAGKKAVLDAENLKTPEGRKAQTQGQPAEQADEGKTIRRASSKGAQRGRRNEKTAFYRWQGALAACAVLAVCIGIFSLLSRNGMLLSPFDKSESGAAMEELAVDDAADMGDALEAAPQQAEGAMADSAAPDAAKDSAAADAARDSAAAETARDSAAADAAKDSAAAKTARDSAASDAAKDSAAPETAITSAQTGAEDAPEDAPAASAENALSASGSGQGTSADEYGSASSGINESDQKKNAVSESDSRASKSDSPEGGMTQKEVALEQLVISVKENSADSVSIVIENAGDRDVVFSRLYEVERLVDGSWQTLDPVKESEEEDEYILGAGDTWEETIRLDRFYGKLSPGQYRLVKRCEIAAAKPPEGTGTYAVYAEFTVSE